jgi:hypothetical protein
MKMWKTPREQPRLCCVWCQWLCVSQHLWSCLRILKLMTMARFLIQILELSGLYFMHINLHTLYSLVLCLIGNFSFSKKNGDQYIYILGFNSFNFELTIMLSLKIFFLIIIFSTIPCIKLLIRSYKWNSKIQ